MHEVPQSKPFSKPPGMQRHTVHTKGEHFNNVEVGGSGNGNIFHCANRLPESAVNLKLQLKHKKNASLRTRLAQGTKPMSPVATKIVG